MACLDDPGNRLTISLDLALIRVKQFYLLARIPVNFMASSIE